jgi:large subunit ribosomal protein L15
MMHKRKKSNRYRASKTHGCGSMKKRRGKGNKGGAGNAGSGKKADQKKPSFWKSKGGRSGFIPKGIRPNICPINIFEIDSLIKKNALTEENGIYDLTKLGFTKLLGKGKLDKGLKIKIKQASKKAVDNIKKIGGEVILEQNK